MRSKRGSARKVRCLSKASFGLSATKRNFEGMKLSVPRAFAPLFSAEKWKRTINLQLISRIPQIWGEAAKDDFLGAQAKPSTARGDRGKAYQEADLRNSTKIGCGLSGLLLYSG